MSPSLRIHRLLLLPLVCTVFLVARIHHNQSLLRQTLNVAIKNDSLQATVPVEITHTPHHRTHRSVPSLKHARTQNETAADLYPFKDYDPYRPRTFFLKDDEQKYYIEATNTTCFSRGTSLVSGGVTCLCLPQWRGQDCSIPESVWASIKFRRRYTNRRITRRKKPRRVINAININHELDLLEIRLNSLYDVVDVFVICESNYTAYGEAKPLHLLPKLRRGFLKKLQGKIVYVFLDHFPQGGRENGWIADDYLRTFLWKQGKKQIAGLRDDDLFVLTDADEIPHAEVLAFLKNSDGYGEPIFWRLRWNIFGFFWLNYQEHIEVSAVCTIKYLREVLKDDAIAVRRGQIPEDVSASYGGVPDEWTIGQNRGQNAGWHCSWCTTVKGMKIKLMSAQKSDGTRWGDFPEKMRTKYLLSLVREGMWFDGAKVGMISPVNSATVPAYVLANVDRFSYMLVVPGAGDTALTRGVSPQKSV